MLRKSFFSPENKGAVTVSSTNGIFSAISKIVDKQAMHAKANLFGLESIGDVSQLNPEQQTAYNTFESIRNELASQLETEFGGVKVSKLFGTEAITCAAMALVNANGAKPYTASYVQKTPVTTDNSINYPSAFAAKGQLGKIFGQERFDDLHVVPYRVSTTALQLASVNQNGYQQLAFPTVPLGPTEYGMTLDVPRGTIQDRAHIRNQDGAPKDIVKNSIIAQYRGVGEKVEHANRLYPIVRTDNTRWLATVDVVGATDFVGKAIQTAPVKIGDAFDYIRVTTPDGYAEFAPTAGTISLAPGGRIEHIYLALDDAADVVRLETTGRSGAQFVFDNTNGFDSNSERLNYEASYRFTKDNIKTLDGTTDSAELKKLVANGETVVIVVALNATLMLENGTLSTSAPKPRIDKIFGANGQEIVRDSWTADQKAFGDSAAKLAYATFDIRRSNSNLEIFGDIVHVDVVKVHYETTINHPISILTTIDAKDSPELLTMLTQAVKLNNHRMATVELLNAQSTIKRLAEGTGLDPIRVQGAPAGALCYLPAYREEAFDVKTGMNNEKSGEILNDISGALRAKIKDMVSELMRKSMYVQAVSSAYVVGEQQKGVKIGIITSQYIADFLQVQGDNRLLGDEYDVQIEVNPSALFDNKIMLFPTTTDNGKTEVSPLQFGLATYCPDVVYDTVATYYANTVKEVRLMNRWCPHLVGCVMGVIDVEGIHDVVTDRVAKTVKVQP